MIHVRSAPGRTPGFSLIELLVVVAIVAILAGLAYPSFMGAVRKSRRADAVEAMAKVQQAQERWRANNSSYTADLSKATGLGLTTSPGPLPSANGYYNVTVNLPTDPALAGSGYTIAAAAVGAQLKDVDCTAMSITVAQGGLITYNSTSADRCWAK